ncbi:MAG: hypothetical protein IH618_06600 [Ignavibacteriaceae bacterium]|nr:hypothetical protein [Ignavibacteriaceae bacterium]
MKYLSDEINSEIVSIVEQKFETVLIDNVDRFINFFNTLADIREAFPDYDEKMMIINTENAKKICDSIKIQIDSHFQRNESLTFENLFPDIEVQLDNLLSQLEPSIKVEQSEERFKHLVDDKNIILFLKKIKITTFKSQQLILRLINPLLTKIKKQPIKVKYWDQEIPLRNVGFYFLRNKLFKNLSSVYHDIFKLLSEKSVAFWKYDESYDEGYILNFSKESSTELVVSSVENPETIISDLELLKEEIKRRTLTAIKECIQEFYNNIEKVGTIEISKSRFDNKKNVKQLDVEKTEFNKIIKEWENTIYALGEDWELNYDLHSARYSAIEVFFKFEKSLSIKNKIQVYPQFNEISGALNFILDKITQPASNLQDLERLIAYSKENLQKVLLSSVIPNLINSMSDLRLAEMIDEAALEVKNQIESITEKRVFVKTSSYDKKIKSSDILEIYPRELVYFHALPKFLTSLEKIKENCIVDLKNIQSELINLGDMADFGLESAITAANTENLSESDVKEIAFEGIKVSVDKKEKLRNSFEQVYNNVIETLRSSISEYNKAMFSFTQNSKISEIRIQLAKAKVKVKARKTRDKFFLSIKNFIPIIFERSKKYYKEGSRFYIRTRKQFGLTEHKESITSEISDFLSKANSSLEKLPYIYRRLFQIAPLENDRLYVSREAEEKQLEIAYKSWLNGGYSPVIISAEKGGGITSFLNMFVNRLENKHNVKRLSIKPSISKVQDLLKIFEEVFQPEKFSSFEELVRYLNIDENRQVIAIENLQHMYLRFVKGLDCLKILTDIISKTSKNIFWITSSTLYANEFLNKTIRLNDIFGYHIPLKQLQRNQIIGLITKRNSISGYKLEYEPDPKLPRKKDFEKLTYEQKQNFLEKEFFSSLNKFAQSNVSLALLFWLRSIREIQERRVFINADFEISNAILNSLSPEKIFVLQSLVLHDGLRVTDLARTINYSLNETRQLAQILYDDGVLVKNDDVFLINPLLYRQSITILKTRNLL